jgi:hypothetical protein
MPLECALRDLACNLEALSQGVAELVTVARDRPESIALADAFEEELGDILMALGEAHTRLIPAQGSANLSANQHDNAELWQALLLCQSRIDHVATQLSTLQSADRIAPLMRFGARQGGEWPSWARLVKEGVNRCLSPLHQLQRAQLLCWHEMAEHSARSVVVIAGKESR